MSRATATGWLQIDKHFGKSKIDHGFILSNHADWKGMLEAVKDSGAEKIITMHGYTSEFSSWLNDNGYNSIEIEKLRNLPFKL